MTIKSWLRLEICSIHTNIFVATDTLPESSPFPSLFPNRPVTSVHPYFRHQNNSTPANVIYVFAIRNSATGQTCVFSLIIVYALVYTTTKLWLNLLWSHSYVVAMVVNNWTIQWRLSLRLNSTLVSKILIQFSTQANEARAKKRETMFLLAILVNYLLCHPMTS